MPSNRSASSHIAVIEATLGRTDDARLALRFAALIEPDREDVHENLAALNALDPRASSHATRRESYPACDC